MFYEDLETAMNQWKAPNCHSDVFCGPYVDRMYMNTEVIERN